MVDACCYVLRTGCAWRLLPLSFAPWQAVYKAFVRWVQADAFERMQDRLRQQWRLRMGRSAEPTAGVIDAQSTRSSPQGGDSGFDAGKKVKGRKRHMVVDTLGLLLAVTVTVASVQDRDGAKEVVEQACRKAPTLELLYTDGAYGGKCAQAIEHAHGIRVEVARRPGNRSTGMLHDSQQSLWPLPTAGFIVLPKRWCLSELTPGTSAADAWLCTTTAGRPSLRPGSGSPRRASCSADSPTSVDFVYTLLTRIQGRPPLTRHGASFHDDFSSSSIL